MKSRTILIVIVLLIAAGAGVFSMRSRSSPSDTGAKQLYTCGMHPQIIKDKPGDCPICGMKLVPVRKQPTMAASGKTGERKVKYYKSSMIPGEISQTPQKDSMGMDMVPVYDDAADTSVIAIDPVTTQNMGLRTGLVTQGPLRKVIRTVANIDFDETMLTDVTTKFKGWIETLYVDAIGKQVHQGDPLFDIYSPDLYTAQVEFLTESQPGTMRQMALTKLKYLDVPDTEIAALVKRGTPAKTLRINAPREGVVIDKMVVQGQMVESGMKLFRLADLSTVWVQAQVYEQDLPFIKLGQEATVSLSYLPDRKFRGRVTYVYPTVDEKTRTAQIRMEFHNPGYFLKPGMFATVQIEAQLGEALLLPDVAVLRSGATNTVFVALDAGRFEPRTVVLGARGEGYVYEVLSGVSEGEKVVTSAQFMLDSESQLREAIQKMLEPISAAPEHAAHEGKGKENSAPMVGPPKPPSTGRDDGPLVFICPMPEHLAITYDHAGKCPLCGMGLVPVRPSLLAKLHPGGRIDHYTCPMPEHADVILAKPGKCPKCSMTLVPVTTPPPLPALAPTHPPDPEPKP
ncbi:efflux RND transporter periplasmic adaptor subunit [Prosthecobacter sp.]|uniref:efflux RND transporter periplasmic adaptor subunit n=1 Tax=Prosthecobacter sp. TaxID=1965333 RepID=UPI0024882433|nr:efflux RND transporter periplasmic adaptor subunit [Prosthecobacter sp.]MDI1314753.1 efflux RND transporter periplasmic adaptor subunit [Prosthecobacter sp.]